MVPSETQGNLNVEKGKLKQKFASLMNNHLMFEEGRKEEIFGKHQVRLGKTKAKLNKITSSLEELNRSNSLYFSTWDESESVL